MIFVAIVVFISNFITKILIIERYNMADEAVGEPPADGENGEVNPEEEEEEVLPPPCKSHPLFVF